MLFDIWEQLKPVVRGKQLSSQILPDLSLAHFSGKSHIRRKKGQMSKHVCLPSLYSDLYHANISMLTFAQQ